MGWGARLILVIFVVDLAVMKISTHENYSAYRYVSIDEGRGQKHGGSVATCSLCLASNNRYGHPADGIFDTNILLSHVEVARISSEIESAYRLYNRLSSAEPLDWVAITKFKTTKNNSEGFL
jgi:hypothetical protein